MGILMLVKKFTPLFLIISASLLSTSFAGGLLGLDYNFWYKINSGLKGEMLTFSILKFIILLTLSGSVLNAYEVRGYKNMRNFTKDVNAFKEVCMHA